MHIRDMQRAADAFRPTLDAAKRAAPEINWFHGDILSNVDALAGLLKNQADIFGRISGGRIADIGAADGDLAFFLEHLGFDCDVIDYPDYNYNGLAGARHLKRALDSAVGIHEIDLDRRFGLPRPYDAALFLGVLYHLKNPYLALETLARSVRYCFLSTRVARWVDSGFWPWQKTTHVRNIPLAYLLDADECNNDPTNYWIFSQAGLERIVSRAGWTVLDRVNYGSKRNSNPRDTRRDERAFLLLESRLP
ncbi:MAG: hypothetical protein HKN58_10160 [Xanthomonadales bacterium]|nr:hypothetical protein [Xanthomonadales bacterium]